MAVVSDSENRHTTRPAARSMTWWVDLIGAIGSTTELGDRATLLTDSQALVPQAGDSVVVLLPQQLSPSEWEQLRQVAERVKSHDCLRVCLLSSFAAHLQDPQILETESQLTRLFDPTNQRRLTVLRSGRLIGCQNGAKSQLKRLVPWAPLVSSSYRSCFVEVDELVAKIGQLLDEAYWPINRTVTLLGKNRELREVLEEQSQRSPKSSTKRFAAQVLRLLLVGKMASALHSLGCRFWPQWEAWRLTTLQPRSSAELLTLYNSTNYDHVALAGNNTGVVHFGWNYPGKTVVKTIASGSRVRIADNTLEVDAGITLKQVNAELDAADRELYVLPNYSYISMGTIFMVPVHGSGSEVSVLGETIEQALLYDPRLGRILRVRRDQPEFGEYMYNPRSDALVLRLWLRIRPKSRYFVTKETNTAPSAADVWQVFLDREASNIELRKSRAGDEEVEICKYYASSEGRSDTMEVPKDTIGRLWDRLEENPISSYLFHTMVKKFGFHVELFLDEDEFPVFWDAHRKLPLSKIQLRYVRGDGLPHSPVGNRDCISADIFMKRNDSEQFLTFMKEHLPNAKYNPGKHSM